MRIHILSAFTLAACLLISACEEPIEIPQEMYLRASVSESGLTSIDVTVDVPEATPFYIAKYESENYKKQGVNPESIVQSLQRRVDLGATWGSILKVGSQTVSFPGLMADTDYTIIAFGLNGAGEITTDPVVIDVHTDDIQFEINMTESRPFDFVAEITPSRDDVGWYAFTFIGTQDRFAQMDDELVTTYMSYYMSNEVSLGSTFSEIASMGTDLVSNENYPDLDVMITVAAVDEKLRIVSKVSRMIFSPSLDGFVAIDEKTTKNLHTMIYAYDNRELGVLLHVTGYDKTGSQGVVSNAMSFNGDSKNYFGIDFYTATDAQIGDVMASLSQYQFDQARNDPQYIPYFQQCTSAQQMMELIWYTPQNLYDNGRVWDRNDASSIVEICGGDDPDEVVFVLGINKITSSYKIYPAEYCISRCSFKELGYRFTDISTKVVTSGHRRLDLMAAERDVTEVIPNLNRPGLSKCVHK